MAPKGKIGYLAAAEVAQSVERALADLAPINCGAAPNLRQALLNALEGGCTKLVVVDSGWAEDKDIIALARSLKTLRDQKEKGTGNLGAVPEMCFAGDALRTREDLIYGDLYALGVKNLYGPDSAEGPYDQMSAVRILATRGVAAKELRRLLPTEDDRDPATRARNYADLALVREAAQTNISPLTKICVFQTSPRNGSTHLAIALARSLRVLKKKVALILPERHFAELVARYAKKTDTGFENPLTPVEGGGYSIGGIAVFPGESSILPSEGSYEFVVFDQGMVGWLKGDALKESDKRQREDFRGCHFGVLSTFMSPTGGWDIAMPDADGVSMVERLPERYAPSTRVAIFGYRNEASLAAARGAVVRGRAKIKVTGIDYIPEPFFAFDDERDIPGCMVDLLCSGIITKKERAELKHRAQVRDEEARVAANAYEVVSLPKEEKKAAGGILGKIFRGNR